MTQKVQHTPNTHLGEIHWWADSFFGSMVPMCQDFLGMNEKPPRPDRKFLDTTQHSVEYLWDFFDEIELDDGMLGLHLFSDDSWHTVVLATIETTIPFGDDIADQVFLNLIEDFKTHVLELPLADPAKREGALWTDEDIKKGYCEEANRRCADMMEKFSEGMERVRMEIRQEEE